MSKLNLLHPTGLKKQAADVYVFILDVKMLKRLNYGKKRLQFMLEWCLDQAIEVYEGDFETTLSELIEYHHIDHMVTQESYDVPTQRCLKDVSSHVMVTYLKDELMMRDVVVHEPSFFKFYKTIEPRLRKRAQSHA